METSKNELAEKVVGKRNLAGNPIDFPVELGYKCPLCGDTYKTWPANGKDIEGVDERLEWSEYEGFLWCSECNIDIPSCLCVPNLTSLEGIERQDYQNNGLKDAIEIFLKTVQFAKEKNDNN